MSEQENFDDVTDIPGAEAEDFSSKEAKKSLSPSAKAAIGIGGVFIAFAAAIVVQDSQITNQASDVNIKPSVETTPGGAVQAQSKNYQTLLEQTNAEKAEEALREGRTFIPTPERILEPINDLELGRKVVETPTPVVPPAPEPVAQEEPEVAVVVTPPPAPAPAPAPQAARSVESQENPYASAILSQMSALSSTNTARSLNVVTVTGAQAATVTAEAAQSTTTEAADVETAATAAASIMIPAGEVLYAETWTSSNSDLPGAPVMVEITSAGEFKGARLIGSFEVNEATDSLVVQFDTMTLPNSGGTYSISAYALDGYSAEAALRSDRDARWLERYGPTLAGGFLASYAQAMATTAQTVTTVADEAVVSSDAPTEEQALYAGLSSVAQMIGQDLMAQAPSGPLITLRDGWPLAVLFTSSVTAGE